MSYLRKGLIAFGVVALAALLLLWLFPARWVVPRIEPRLHGVRLEQVQGSVWDGSVARVVRADGQPMGRLEWHVSRLALLGRLRMQLALDGPQMSFSASVKRLSADRIQLDAVKLHLPLDRLGQRVPVTLGEPHGDVQGTIDHALLQGGWPLQLQAAGQWRDAALRTPDGFVPLGVIDGEASAQGGIVQVQLHDDGSGPLEASGDLQVIPLGWRLEATLRERRPDAALHRWLMQFGQPDEHGRIHLRRSGGLAGNAPTTTGHAIEGTP